MAAAAILDFIFVQYFGIRVCRTSSVIHMPNFVQICAIVNELWAINGIQNGGRRHLEFIIFSSILVKWFIFGGSRLYFCNISFIYVNRRLSYWLLFVQKSKMAAAAILNYNFVMLDNPRSPFVYLKFPFKFCVDRVPTFRDIAIQKFRKFGLKCLFSPSKIMFLGEFWPSNIIFYHRDP